LFYLTQRKTRGLLNYHQTTARITDVLTHDNHSVMAIVVVVMVIIPVMMVVRLCICRSRKEGNDSEQQYLLHAKIRCR
jgi:heme/copper-type cytochrome/quinol oxidase subunit 2